MEAACAYFYLVLQIICSVSSAGGPAYGFVDYSTSVSTTIANTDGDAVIEAFPLIQNTSSNAKSATEVKFVSLGQPALIAYKQPKNEATAQQKIFQFSQDGFHVYVSVLSDAEKAALASAASEVYGKDVKPSQIKRLIPDEFSCNLEVNVNGSKLQYFGKTIRNNIFPLRVEFDAPAKTLLRQKFEEVVNSESEIKVDCTVEMLKQPARNSPSAAVGLYGTSQLNTPQQQYVAFVRRIHLYTSSVPLAEVTIEALVEKKMYELRAEFEKKYNDRLDQFLAQNVTKQIASTKAEATAMLTEAKKILKSAEDKQSQEAQERKIEIQSLKGSALGKCKLCKMTSESKNGGYPHYNTYTTDTTSSSCGTTDSARIQQGTDMSGSQYRLMCTRLS